MDLQIDDFHRDLAAALLSLYQSFPRRVALYVEDLAGPEAPDEFGLPSPRHQACLGALLWLADEGYLRYESRIGHQALDQAVLTEKAFLRLATPRAVQGDTECDLPPSVRRQRGTLAFRLRQALKAADGERLGELCRQLLGANATGGAA